jgi:hypothetical protein
MWTDHQRQLTTASGTPLARSTPEDSPPLLDCAHITASTGVAVNQPLLADHQAIHQAGADLVAAAGAFDQARQDVGNPRIGDADDVFGEYSAGAQFPGFRQAWLDEIGVHHDAMTETGQAIMSAADRYGRSDSRVVQRFGG